MTASKNMLTQHRDVTILFFLFCIALLLRTLFLGHTFQSSDNAELAARILKNPGYSWIFREYYGALINLYVKFFVGVLSYFGVTISEFWWKLPIAILGTIQVPMTYFFLKHRIACSNIGALFGAALICTLPIHVFQSRYLWGYEVLGVFFVTLAIWKLLVFFENPTLKTGLLASLFSGIYFISHGYIMPFIPCLLAIIILFTQTEKDNILDHLTLGIKLCWRNLVWLFPLLFLPLTIFPIGHSFRKQTEFGFYLQDHALGFIQNIGYSLTSLILASIIVSLCVKSMRSKFTILFIVCSVSYLAPLFFGTPRGITVIRGYMLVGIYFLVLCTVLLLDKLVKIFRRFIVVLISLCFVLTIWGTAKSIFSNNQLFDPSGIKIERGGIPPDPGSKAAGYLIRKYVNRAQKVLAIHGSIEPPILFYYFARLDYSFYDSSLEESIDKFHKLKDKVDVVICGVEQSSVVETDSRFIRRSEILSKNMPRMLIYTRPDVEIPAISIDVRDLNASFDREYSWRVSLR